MLFVCYVAVRLSYLIPIHSDILSAVAFFFGLAFFLNVQSTLHLTLVFAFAPFAVHMILLKSITTTQKNLKKNIHSEKRQGKKALRISRTFKNVHYLAVRICILWFSVGVANSSP